MKKWLQLMVLAMISILVLAACGDSTGGDGSAYSVGATQIVEHPSLDRAYEGFQAALEDAELDVDYDFQSAQGDPNNIKPISEGFVADGVDLIFANSTPSAQGALNETNDIPIVFTSVTDAVDADLVPSMDEAGENITGVVDLHPNAIEETVNFIDTYFQGATVGLIYNAGEPNSVTQIEAVEAAVDGTSLSIEDRTVANASEVQQAATTLVSDIDVFYIVTDNTVVEALDSVVGVANEHDIPLVVGEPDSLAKGGFVTFGIDYYTIGYRSGEMAADILTGEKSPNDIAPEYPSEIQLFINKGAAEEQGIEWQDEWDDEAEFVETEE
ncbi:putative ABC transport system substrate-binding protein [Oceanobacillus limi]|uniref:Putative ABC transport system substrate-binding protein n=1 Tax=Oceanobacillus limi TaxID=930131 RepID=A0A1I0EX74_9BACI|nr:ABC transporter substrate-binding protein [Oceanobacillus limi]SET50258.1 putative ABC transport system substrate-binding protein [Oceanobacillus limi]